MKTQKLGQQWACLLLLERREQAIVATKFTFYPNWGFIGTHPYSTRIQDSPFFIHLHCLSLYFL